MFLCPKTLMIVVTFLLWHFKKNILFYQKRFQPMAAEDTMPSVSTALFPSLREKGKINGRLIVVKDGP